MGVFNTIRNQLQKLLSSDPFFADVPVLKANDHDWQTKAKTDLEQSRGLCILIHGVNLTSSTDSQGPQGTLKLRVAAVENYSINQSRNGSRIPSSDAAEYAAWLLHSPNHDRADVYLCTVNSLQEIPNPKYIVHEIEIQSAGVLVGEHTEEEV
jgi:hypothetical protein